MRFSIHDIDALKRKAKFLKKYLGHPFIGRPDIALGTIQRTLAVGLGYTDWAELAVISKRAVLNPTSAAGNSMMFQQVSRALERLAGIDGCLADALAFRMGFVPGEGLRAPVVKKGFPCLLYADLLLDRLLEVEEGSSETMLVRQALNGIYDCLVDGLVEDHASEGWEGRMAAVQWLETVSVWRGWKTDGWRKKVDPFRLPKAYTPVDRIVKVAEHLPQSGLLVMSGCFGSGRSMTARLLSLALRRGRTTMFHMTSELRANDATTPHAVYRGEIRDPGTFAAAVKDIDKKVVMLELAAGSPGSAHMRVSWLANAGLAGNTQDWLRESVIGGFHHDYWEPDGKPNLMQSITGWRMKHAWVSEAIPGYPDGYVDFRELASL